MARKKDDLPDRLRNDRGMYRYKPPGAKEVAIGRDRDAAIEAANILNGMPANKLANKVAPQGYTMGAFLKLYLDELRVEREWTAATWRGYNHKATVIQKSFLGAKLPGLITVLDVNAFLSAYPPSQANNYRSFLKLVFQYAISLGQCPINHNPAGATMKKKVKRKRARLTLEQFREVLTHASPMDRNAFTLALLTLQREGDISNLRWSDIKNGIIYFVQHKTGTPVKIEVSPQIKAVLDGCRDGVISPYVIHYGMSNRKKTMIGGQVTGDVLSKHFRIALKACGFGLANPPSFHELRPLGADLLRQAGVSDDVIRQLLGHSDIAMTRVYLDGHKINWERVPSFSVAVEI